MRWDNRHSGILEKIYLKFNNENIRYFILRNYEGLPNVNSSKDVDFIVDPISVFKAVNIVKQVYKENEINHYYEVQFGKMYCCHGINSDFGIHIDIIGSYVSKGFGCTNLASS